VSSLIIENMLIQNNKYAMYKKKKVNFTSAKTIGSNVGNLYTAISLELYAPVANNVLDGFIFNE